jgi:Domain of unknown function (DUF4267)
MRRRGSIDPAARAALLAVAAGRISIGVGALFATRPALRVLGFPEPDVSAWALGQLAGGRDLALGTLVLLAREDRPALRTAALAGAAVDAVDALTLGLAYRRSESIGPAGAIGALSGGAAAAVGLWAARRL